ncbi:ABC transporter permease [Siphonobacter sp.]|uniref:ABC transporter permease n=1 Tax=Siphonobacter sp. TaxID=1869184 RepID=UPI003B3AB1D9
MFQNYLKLALRNLWKSRLFTGLNMLGLSLGLTVSLLLFLYIKDELAFDRYHRQAEQIYRVNLAVSFDGKEEKWATAPNIVGPIMQEKIPGVKQQVRFLKHNFGESAFITTGEKKFVEKSLYWADSTLFQVFDIPLVQGNPQTALEKPNQVLISQRTAERYFGSENPLGKDLKVDNRTTLEVTGVYADFPDHSSFDANLIGSFATETWAYKNLSWSNASFETYVLLNPQTQPTSVERQLDKLIKQNVPEENRYYTAYLQPLTDLHLHSEDVAHVYTQKIGDPQQVRILVVLAIVVLVIACINYMNLSTARSQQRFREVGINKALGASRSLVARRFYIETAILVLLSILLSIALLEAFLPVFNRLASRNLTANAVLSPEVIVGLVLTGTLVTLIAGSYPALYLSSYSPKNLLQTNFRANTGAGLFRRSLVVIQFTASIVLVISSIIFYQQLRFVQHQKLGYQPEQVVAITTVAAESKTQIDGLINRVRSLPDVVEVSRAQTFPASGGSGRSLRKNLQSSEEFKMTTNRATPDFVQVLGLKLIAGKTLPSIPKDAKDTTVQVVLNRKAVAFLGYTPENAIGRKAYGLFGDNNTEIVGVVEDFHFENFHQPIGGYAFHNANTESYRYLLVKLRTQRLTQAMSQLENVFSESLPQSAFDYTFLDQYLNNLYQTEQRTAQVVLVFSILTILIACLGLFGLAAYAAEQRTKEIGVRKVLGANEFQLVTLLSSDFLKLVGLAFLIASPLAWWMMNEWLTSFAYRIQISGWVFVVAGLLALLIALLTVSSQALRAALMNPVRSLKSE